MALSKVDYNSLDVTAAASKSIGWDSDPDALATSTLGGAWTLISTTTASSSASLSITSGLDSTYKVYCFRFYNIHPATNNSNFTVGFRDGSTDYDATKTTTFFDTYHYEDDTSGTGLRYLSDTDLAASTSYHTIGHSMGIDNDQSFSGYMYLFEPSSTTFVKNFFIEVNNYTNDDRSTTYYSAGYCSVTAAIDGVDFKFSSGNVDAGVIKLYGIN